MSWRVVSLSAAVGLWLFPAVMNAQANTEESEARAPEAEASVPAAEEPSAPETVSAKGLLGDLRVGGSVALGVPHPITAGVDLVYADLIALSVSGGNYGINVDDTDIEIRNWEAAARWFPFRGSFFVGAAFGNQGIVGKRKVDLEVDSGGVTLTVPTTLRLEIESSYMTPQLGWFARWDSGLTIGFDIGLQLPSGAKTDLQTSFENVSAASEASVRNSDDYKKNKKDVEDAAEAIGKQAIPYITLFRLGWLF